VGSYNVNDIRFADSASTWNRNRIGGGLEVKGPYQYGSPLRYEVLVKVYRELIEDEKGVPRPPDGYYVGVSPELTWDKYHWHDLVPSGYRIALALRPGFFFGANQQRHEAELNYLHGIPLGSTTVLMINSVAEAVNDSGNPNHSLLIGSIAGVRGLSDNLYRNRARPIPTWNSGTRFKWRRAGRYKASCSPTLAHFNHSPTRGTYATGREP
jgi:hypothetical protein